MSGPLRKCCQLLLQIISIHFSFGNWLIKYPTDNHGGLMCNLSHSWVYVREGAWDYLWGGGKKFKLTLYILVVRNNLELINNQCFDWGCTTWASHVRMLNIFTWYFALSVHLWWMRKWLFYNKSCANKRVVWKQMFGNIPIIM